MAAVPPKQPSELKRPPVLKEVMLGRYERKKDRLVLGSAIFLAIIIFGLWGWNMASEISLIHWNATPEKGLLDITKNSWERAFAENGTSTKSIPELQAEISDSLRQIVSQLTTSTISTVSSTTITTTPAVASGTPSSTR